jgi:hypothetical protein
VHDRAIIVHAVLIVLDQVPVLAVDIATIAGVGEVVDDIILIDNG